tara:strand:- start:3025 stop:3786 length:762 start_codon:yes stop_codon:yes gene_type:complete
MIDYKDKIREKYKKILFVHGWGFNHEIWEDFAKSYMPLERCIFLNLYDYLEYSNGDMRQAAQKVLDDHPKIDLVISWSLGCYLAKEIEAASKERHIKMVYVSYTPKFTQSGNWEYGFEQKTIDELKENLDKDFTKALKNFYLLILGDFKSKKSMYKKIIAHLRLIKEIEIKNLYLGLKVIEKSDYKNFCKSKRVENLYIYGDKDLITSPSIKKFIKKLEPSSEINILSESSHIPFITNPENFFKVLKNHILAI